MRATGKRSSTDPHRWWLIVLVAALLGGAPPACALDLFTLWRQPDLPFAMTEGAWVDYRTQVMAGGRQQEDLLRLVCVADDCGAGRSNRRACGSGGQAGG